MNLQRYEYFVKNNFSDFEFFSEGPNGRIKKAVRFTKLTEEEPFLYNLGFGDVSETTGDIDDTARRNNNDRDMVLATVARTVIDFTNAHGNPYILAIGITPVRTRLYQMGISKLWSEISVDFIVQGYVDGNWRPFERDVNYEAFLVKRKENGTFEI